jgi:hypothetical protein
MERRQFLRSTGLGAAATMLGVAPLTAATTHLSFLKENVMSDQPRPYEPLTSENAALILIDHQVGLMTGVRDYSTGELKHNVVGGQGAEIADHRHNDRAGQHVGPDLSRTRRGVAWRSNHRSLVCERVRRS